MFAKTISAACLGILLACATAAQAADLPGSKDPSFLKRYEGSEIISYESRPFDSYRIAGSDPKNPASYVFTPIEGQVTRVVYHGPPGHTVLEFLRNYEQALKEAGLTQTFELPPSPGNDFAFQFYAQGWESVGGSVGCMHYIALQQTASISFKGTVGGQDVKGAVLIGDYPSPQDCTYAKPVHFNPGELTVVVDVVSSKAVKMNMVFVKATDMANALATKGFVDLYGIYFDVDKTDVKPESGPTLDEVANLLKSNQSLKPRNLGPHRQYRPVAAQSETFGRPRRRRVVKKYWSRNTGSIRTALVAKGYGDSKPVAPEHHR